LTAIDNLVKKADELNKDCLKNLGLTIEEIVDAGGMIQTLIDIALDLQDQLSRLIVTHIEFELPFEEGKAEIPAKSDIEPYPLQIHDHLTNIGPINIYSIAGALSDTIREFTAQTTGVASIFTPYAFFDTSQSYSREYAGMLPFTGIKEPEKQASIIDKTHSIGTGTLYPGLKESALIIKEMETIRDRMAVLPIEKGSAPASIPVGVPANVPVSVPDRADIHGKVTDTLVLPGYEIEYAAGSGIVKDIDEFSGYVHNFFRIVENISTTIKTSISEARDVTDISSLQKISMEALTAVDLDITSTAVRTRISEIHSVAEMHESAGISSIEGISTGALPTSDISKSEPLHKITPVQQMIEVPDFMPVGKVPTAIKESAINAAALTNAIGREFMAEKETLSYSREVMTPSLADVHMVQPSISTSSVSVSNAFNTISDYFTIASELGSQMTDMMEYGGEEVSDIFTHGSPIDLLVTGEDTGTALSLERIVFGGNDGTAGIEPGIGLSITTTESLIKEGASAINDVFLSLPQDRTGYGGLPAATVPRAMENVMQMFYGSRNETTPLSPNERSTNHFQNTFNVVVNMKGAGDEHELRELGRKIGTILSDEIKRYGGVV
jgi:hypothetical protein